jgi:hypothetical protein
MIGDWRVINDLFHHVGHFKEHRWLVNRCSRKSERKWKFFQGKSLTIVDRVSPRGRFGSKLLHGNVTVRLLKKMIDLYRSACFIQSLRQLLFRNILKRTLDLYVLTGNRPCQNRKLTEVWKSRFFNSLNSKDYLNPLTLY